MDNSRLVVAVVLSLCLAVLTGCGDAPQHESEAKIMDAVNRADRLCDRAQIMIDEVVVTARVNLTDGFEEDPGPADPKEPRGGDDGSSGGPP